MFASAQTPINFQIARITFGTMVIPATLAAQSANTADPVAPGASAALVAHGISAAAHTAIRA